MHQTMKTHCPRMAGCLLLCLSSFPGCGLLGEENVVHLGFTVENASLSSFGGVLVASVLTSSPAERAGLLPDDIIRSVNDRQVRNMATLNRNLADIPLGGLVTIHIFRPGQMLTTARRQPGATLKMELTLAASPEGEVPTTLGFSFADAAEGVSVMSVAPDSIAGRAGMRTGDLIASLDEQPIVNGEGLRKLLAEVTPNQNIVWQVKRAGSEQPLTLKMKAGPDALSLNPLLGTVSQDLTAEIADLLGYGNRTGARIKELLTTSPVLEAGLMAGDVITAVEIPGESERVDITSARECGEVLHRFVGQTVLLEYVRGQLPLASVEISVSGDARGGLPVPQIGFSLEEVATDTGFRLRVEALQSSGASGGLKEEDVITHVNGHAVTTVREFWRELLRGYSGAQTRVRLDYELGGDPLLPQVGALTLSARPSASAATTQPATAK